MINNHKCLCLIGENIQFVIRLRLALVVYSVKAFNQTVKSLYNVHFRGLYRELH